MESDIEKSPSSAPVTDQWQTAFKNSNADNVLLAASEFEFSSLKKAITSEILETILNNTKSPESLHILSDEGETFTKEPSGQNNDLNKENEEWKNKFIEEVLETERLTNELVKLKGNIITEGNPARRTADAGGDFKTKQIAEKLKQLEKEKRKLQDHVESLELELTAKDNEYKSLHEKLTEERKARLEKEHRFTSSKPPLPMRMPLRKITNVSPSVNGSNRKPMQPKRASLAAGHAQGPTLKPPVSMPRRRVTIALRPESGSSSVRTPLPRPSLIPRRGFRKSNLYTPMPEFLPPAAGESDKFMSSVAGKHPVGVPLPRKSLMWSPLMAKTGSCKKTTNL